MRLSLSFNMALFYALLIHSALAQSVITLTAPSSESADPVPTSTPLSPTNPPDPEPTDPATTIFPTSDTWTTFTTSLGTAAPPDGGGATCVQDCLAIAAAGAGCSSSVDIRCVCSSSTFVGLAQHCFGSSTCDSASAAKALNDQRVVCGASATTSQGQSTQDAPTLSAPTPVRTTSPTLSGFNTVSRQATPTTLVLSSGAVLTVSGIRTTLTAGLTSVVSQPAGSSPSDPAASSSPNKGPSNLGLFGMWSLVAAGFVSALAHVLVGSL